MYLVTQKEMLVNTHFGNIGLTIYTAPSGITTIAQRDELIVIPAELLREVVKAIALHVQQLVPSD